MPNMAGFSAILTLPAMRTVLQAPREIAIALIVSQRAGSLRFRPRSGEMRPSNFTLLISTHALHRADSSCCSAAAQSLVGSSEQNVIESVDCPRPSGGRAFLISVSDSSRSVELQNILVLDDVRALHHPAVLLVRFAE